MPVFDVSLHMAALGMATAKIGFGFVRACDRCQTLKKLMAIRTLPTKSDRKLIG